MNYITSCPKCETHFLLNNELIKAHRGKVQCGSCELIFNAKTRLTEVADDITSAEEYQAIVEENARHKTEEKQLNTANSNQTSSDTSLNELLGERSPTNISNEPEPSFDVNSSPIVDEFLSGRNTQQKPAKKSTIISLSILSLIFILTAALQTIYHMRSRVAAEYPQFKPILVKVCATLHCTIELPKNLNLITIGDSDMQEDDNYESVINFTSSLTNNANFPQAYPSVELTLTNADNKVVITKLISPKDYLLDQQKIKDGLTPREINVIKLALYVHEASVAGYRILLVY